MFDYLWGMNKSAAQEKRSHNILYEVSKSINMAHRVPVYLKISNIFDVLCSKIQK
jgi:hypothetical protein